MSAGTIVVTNDDGIDSPGIRRLVESLDPLGEVIAVAPASNQSAVGRAIDASATIESHPFGYAIHGSPSTCVVTAATALDLDPVLVVSGVNKGANLGAPMLGRSGTIGAAIEAAYLDIPAIAVSAYVPFERIQGNFHEFQPEPDEFDPATDAAVVLAETLLTDGPVDGIDYFNINAPLTDDLRDPTIHVTAPAEGYHTEADRDGDQVMLVDRQFELLHAGELDPAEATDRAVLANGGISVSPLRLPTQSPGEDALMALEQRLFDDVAARLNT